MKKFKRLKPDQVDLIVYDFDGVMTDNRVFLLANGMEGVLVNRADGLGVKQLRALGIPQIILSMEANPVVKARGTKLGLKVISGCLDKKLTLASYCRSKRYGLSKVVFIGNDINDKEVMGIVGYPVCPADAHPAIKLISKLILYTRGGQGVIKEFAENWIER
jgi:YrbI family 3-deoxy-D-manno-octulosonate 8-phosphate phosphatase